LGASFLLTQEIDIYVIYEAAIVKDYSDDFNEPYLPARYKEIVRKKKQRRLLKKIAMIAVAVIALVGVYILLSGFFMGSPQPAPSPTPSPSPTATILQTTAAAVATTPVPTSIPVTTAVPATGTTTRPTAGTTVTTTDTPEPILTAMAGAFKTVTPSTTPKITEQQAEAIALTAFPNLPASDMTAELATSPDFGQVWKYTLRADTTTEASGLLDAETGSIVTFNRTIHPGARPQNPVLTLGNARQIADSTINSRNNGILSINMSDSRYVPLATPGGNVAGSYRFIYNRIIQDHPCDADGFIVSVDAITGAITEWMQRWQTPDNAFMLAEDAVVPKFDAIYTVQAKAKSIYPSSIPGLHILSAEIRWKDRHDPATTPRPSTIPLAWKIIFDDETIRTNPKLSPGIGWVDAQTGEIIEITYSH
jgi:cytoskeletal protein RodZ